jgi:hypothetical protein
MTIKVVHTATKNKPHARYCPWMIDCGVDPADQGKK